jgi:hypothetical protein
MACYFNLGLDAKLAWAASNLPRSNSRWGNKFVYLNVSAELICCDYTIEKASKYLIAVSQGEASNKKEILSDKILSKNSDPI